MPGTSAEILVVDDGSDDATVEILAAMAQQFGPELPLRVHRFAQNTPGGVASAANWGLNHFAGDLLVFIDGDDWVVPGSLAAVLQQMQHQTWDVLITDCAEFWNDTGLYTKWPETSSWAMLETDCDAEAQRKALLHMAPFPWRKIYRRSFLQRTGLRFPEGDFFFEDNPFHWDVILQMQSWGWVRRETHIHRRARAGQSLELDDTGYLMMFQHFDTIKAMLESSGKMQRHAPDLAKWLLHHTPWMAGRLATSQWPGLFARVREKLAHFTPSQIWEGLYAMTGTGHFTPAELRQAHAVVQGDWLGFVRGYDPEKAGNPRDQDRGESTAH